jgi:hypothetical protein
VRSPLLRHHESLARLRLTTLLAASIVASTVGVASVATASVAGRTARSGLYGTVRRGPTMPVCRQGQPCDAPAKVTLVFSRDGAEVARTRSSAKGSYRLALGPGLYSVRTTGATRIGRGLRPARVRVRPGRFDRIDFFIDTGIR